MTKLTLSHIDTRQMCTWLVDSTSLEVDRNNRLNGFTVKFDNGSSESYLLHEIGMGEHVRQIFKEAFEYVKKPAPGAGTASRIISSAAGKRYGNMGHVGGGVVGFFLPFIVEKAFDQMRSDRPARNYGYYNQHGEQIFEGPLRWAGIDDAGNELYKRISHEEMLASLDRVEIENKALPLTESFTAVRLPPAS